MQLTEGRIHSRHGKRWGAATSRARQLTAKVMFGAATALDADVANQALAGIYATGLEAIRTQANAQLAPTATPSARR